MARGAEMDRRTVLGAGFALAASSALASRACAAAAPAEPHVGAKNLITDVPGLKIGQAEDAVVRTGVTVILPDEAAVVATDVRGGGPATRETDATEPQNLVHAFDAVVLSGGSVYGLASADGVVSWLGAKGRGYGLASGPGVPKSPVVPAAALYDTADGGDKAWGLDPPYRALAIKAVESASDTFQLGTHGAGYGAMAGGLKGGIGSASIVSAEGFTVGAIVAVNSAGGVVAPGTKQFWAAPMELNKEFGGLGSSELKAIPEDFGARRMQPRKNTTIALVATDAKLTSDEAKRVAMMAQDGIAEAIRPAHTPFDGDVVFAMSTGKLDLAEPRAFTVAKIGALAADTLARAIARAVYEATPFPGANTPTWKGL